MPEGLLSAIHLVLQTREARIARSNATYPRARCAATNSAIRRYGRNWRIASFSCDGELDSSRHEYRDLSTRMIPLAAYGLADHQARGAASRGHDRDLWAVRRVHQARAQGWLSSNFRQRLLRRRRRNWPGSSEPKRPSIPPGRRASFRWRDICRAVSRPPLSNWRGRTRPVPACYGPSTRSAGSISAEASSPSERRCRTRHPRSSSPYRRTDPSRPSTGRDGETGAGTRRVRLLGLVE